MSNFTTRSRWIIRNSYNEFRRLMLFIKWYLLIKYVYNDVHIMWPDNIGVYQEDVIHSASHTTQLVSLAIYPITMVSSPSLKKTPVAHTEALVHFNAEKRAKYPQNREKNKRDWQSTWTFIESEKGNQVFSCFTCDTSRVNLGSNPWSQVLVSPTRC